MSAQPSGFKPFLQQRQDASVAWVNGDASPLERIATQEAPATFFGPGGGCENGVDAVLKAYRAGAAHFDSGQTNFEVISTEAGSDLAYVTGVQHATFTAKGKHEAQAMDLRITEIFRRENGQWKLVHRHADEVKKS